MAGPAIQVRGLRKSYGSFEAVRGVDLVVERGEVFALLGPNGAGKTTIVEILEGHRARSQGEVDVLGYDPERQEQAFRERIGIVLQATSVEPYLTVGETVELFRGYYSNPLGLEETLALVGLTEQRDMRVRRLSGGQQRRLDVAVGLAGNPELLFLDEPTTGFDPSARREAWEMVQGLQSLGKTILLTTHYMEEAQTLAGRVAIMAGGRIIAEGPPRDLMQQDDTVAISFRHSSELPLPTGLPGRVDLVDGLTTIHTEEPTRALNMLTGWALKQSMELEALSVSRTSLEDVYLELTRAAGEESPQ